MEFGIEWPPAHTFALKLRHPEETSRTRFKIGRIAE
jgi:hypothetical protein